MDYFTKISVVTLGILFSINMAFTDVPKTIPTQASELKVVKVAKPTSKPSDNIKLIIGQGQTKNYYARVRAIHALGKYLRQDEIEALYTFLYDKLEDQKLPDLEFNAIKNEIVLKLMQQRIKPEALAGHLVEIYNDKSFDPTWRDYCVQFFGKWYEKAPNNDGKKAMKQGLYDALKERKGSIGGTAITMLCHLTHLPDFDKKKIADLAYELITSPDCSISGRTSGLQVCAELEDKEALPLARNWVVNSKKIFIKMSAMAAIGMLGDSSDLSLLEQYSTSTDIRLRTPAIAAIRKIKSRH